MILTRPRLAVLGTVCLVALTGCGGGGGSNTAAAAGSEAGGLRVPAAAGPAADRADAQSFSRAQVAKPGVDVQEQAIIRNGDLSIRTSDPQQARDGVDHLLVRLHGSLDDERTVYDKLGRIRDSHLVLRVPVDSFGTAMNDLEKLGTVVHSSSTGKDVTTEVIDVQQRLRTLRISLRDLNAFQRKAATIDQLLRFENAITERRGQYQSLKAQRDHLADQTSMSTIEPGRLRPARPRHDGRAPLAGGVRDRAATRLDRAHRHGARRTDRAGRRTALRGAAGPGRPAVVVVDATGWAEPAGHPGPGLRPGRRLRIAPPVTARGGSRHFGGEIPSPK